MPNGPVIMQPMDDSINLKGVGGREKMIVIIAPNKKVFEHYVRNKVRYVYEPNQLRGIDPANTRVILLSNWYEVNDQRRIDELHQMLMYLEGRGATIDRTEY